MKTIQQFVTDGIRNVAELQDALQTAMQLEFSTLPPYLCAEWSIDPTKDPDRVVRSMINGIVIQEMFHFALAGNMLSAVGRTPSIANSDFLVKYPTNKLPGDIFQQLAVDLKPLSKPQLDVFMQIEDPQFTPVALDALAPPKTIGEFYDTIATAFTNLNPPIDANAFAVDFDWDPPSQSVKPIRSRDDALAAITRIKSEGEGTPMSPEQAGAMGEPYAHYYEFKEISAGKQLGQAADGSWGFNGPDIHLPGVFDFAPSAATPDPTTAFQQTLSQLLVSLQACWTSAAQQPDTGKMGALRQAGIALIKKGITPKFAWAPGP